MTAQADQLLAAGRAAEAVQLVSRLAGSGDAGALFKLGQWRLEGRIVPRDLPQSRELFRRAGEAGNLDALRIYTAFVANGTGGPSDWQLALKLLRARARKDQSAKRQLWLIEKMDLTSSGDPVSVPAARELSDSLDIRQFDGLFTGAECAYLIEAAKPNFQPSVVVDQAGRQIPNPIRTSDTAGFPWALENPAIHAINRRLAAVSGTDSGQGEPLQVLRYAPGQQYKPHFDAVPGLDNQRYLTALIYLNGDYEGGETSFPRIGLSVRGARGDVLLFRNSNAAGEQDALAMHAGLPVEKGTKIIASRWIRERRLEA